MKPRLLVDENLSPALVSLAHHRGYECAHVAHLGRGGWKDWSLLELIAQEDWVLVTNNAIEFRGRFGEIELHPGVIFIIPSVPRAQQLELFAAVLDVLDDDPDLINAALDVRYNGEAIVVERYPLP